MACRHPRDARVEGIEQRRFPLALRLRDAHVERRAHHETLDLRLHDPVRAARTRQAQLVATLRAHVESAWDIVTIRWRSCRAWRLLDGDELDVEHEHAGRHAGLAFVRERLRDPQATLLTHHHQLHAFGPARTHLGEWKRNGLPAHPLTVEHLSIRRPAGIVHGDGARGPGMHGAGTGPDDLRCQARGTAIGIDGWPVHVRWHGRHLGRRRALEELHVEDQCTGRLARLTFIAVSYTHLRAHETRH